MKEITLRELLEAGCHFGHQVKRWHPKASAYIYQARDGIHIIDLVQTRAGLIKAANFVTSLARDNKKILFVATKRQAKAVVSEEAKRIGVPYLTQRWIGGFVTNWDEVKKNLEKVRSMRQDRDAKAWEKYPKHEQVKLGKTLKKLELFYGGVAEETTLPDALFVVDMRKEDAAVREALARHIPLVAIVDTNVDPTAADYPIPANDDAVGSIAYIAHVIAEAYALGKTGQEKIKDEVADGAPQVETVKPKKRKKPQEKKTESVEEEKQPVKVVKTEVLAAEPEKKKRGRKKKTLAV